MRPFKTRVAQPTLLLVALAPPRMRSTRFLISPIWKEKMQDNRYVNITNGAVPYERIRLQLAILNHMMGKAVSIKEGAEAVLHGNAPQLTVLLFRGLSLCANGPYVT